jgi:uncharacterized protein YacL
MSLSLLARVFGMVAFGALAWWLGITVMSEPSSEQLRWLIILTLAGAAAGALLLPRVTLALLSLVWRTVRGVPALDLAAGTLGLLIGLIISALLSLPLSMLPGMLGRILPFLAALVCSSLGVTITVLQKHELLNLWHGTSSGLLGQTGRRNLLDTSAIIDGRVADIGRTGFLPGELLVPGFVLEEVQRIADSPNPLTRARGRRGLDVLQRLQKEALTPVTVVDWDFEAASDVDAKLVQAAKAYHCTIITTDFNLHRVAELQGVAVLNLNDLATAVRPVVLPGEELAVRIIQEGRQADQGVGFLDDGTMIVVENGRKHLNSEVQVVVARVTQTVAGRIIFAHPKFNGEGGRRPVRREDGRDGREGSAG